MSQVPTAADEDEQSIGVLISDLLIEALRDGLDLLSQENALDHVPVERRLFEPGDRSVADADLGDISGVIEIDAKFENAPPSNLRWALDVPYRVTTAVLEADSNDPRTDLYAGQPGVHEIRIEETDGDETNTKGRLLVSVPWFTEITVAQSFDDLVSDTGMDRDRLLRRARTVADHLLSLANVRTVWTDAPFSEVLPPQFQPPAQQPTTGTFLVTGRGELQTDLEGCAQNNLLAVELKGSHTVDVGQYASGASLYVGDVQPERDSVFASILEQAIDRLDFAEELTARYLGIEITNHILLGMDIPPADGVVERTLGGLTYPDLHLLDDRLVIEWYLLGIRIHSPEAFPREISYLDRVRAKREDRGLPLGDDQFGLPKPPFTPLDELASAFPDAREAIERTAPLSEPLPDPERGPDEKVHRVTNSDARLRNPTDEFAFVRQPGQSAPQADKDAFQDLLSRPHVSLNSSAGSPIIDEWTQLLVMRELDHEDEGKMLYVTTTDGDVIGWTAATNLQWYLRDNDPGYALAPDATASVVNQDPFERQVVTIYNRVGGLFEHLSSEFGIDVGIPIAFYRNEGGNCDLSHRNDPMLRFENHTFWRKWGRSNAAQYNQYFDYGADDNWRGHRFCVSGNCQPDDWEMLHGDPVCSDAFQDLQVAAVERAATLADRDTALKAASIGYPQIMGGNHGEIGYESPSDMYVAFAADERAQVLAVFDYLRTHTHTGDTGIELAQLGQNQTRTDQYWTDLSIVYNGEPNGPVPRSQWANSGVPPTYASGLETGFGVATTVLSNLNSHNSGDGSATTGFTLNDSVGASGTNDPADVRALRQRLNDLGFDWLPVNDAVDQALNDAISLVQSIKNGDDTVTGDGRVDVPGDTYDWLRATNAPEWQLMPVGGAGDGYENYERQDQNDHHDYGTNWMAETIRSAGEHYRDNYLINNPNAALLTVNDVSLPEGGDTPDHGGHETGLVCDLRLPRTDGNRATGVTINDPNYDRAATRAMLEALTAQPQFSFALLADRTLVGEGLCRFDRHHDDHIHFAISAPARNTP